MDTKSNLFAFQFSSHADRDYLLIEGQTPSLLIAIFCYDWGKKQTISFARLFAPNARALASCDEATMLGVDKALRCRFDIDLFKLLLRGICVIVVGKPIWIRLKFIKLSNFCIHYGKFDGVLKDF